MSDAFLAGMSFKVGDGVAPPGETFNKLEEVKTLGPVGQTNDTVEVTNFDSNNAKEFIAGLKDGSEFEVGCNYLLTNNTIQQQLRTDCLNAVSARNIEIEFTDGTNTETLSFAVTCVGQNIAANLAEANLISYTLKITGDITYT